MTRTRCPLSLRLASLTCTLVLAGCAGPWLRPWEKAEIAEEEPPREFEADLIADVTHPYGMNFVQVEAVSLVKDLDGTGGDPPPSPQRASLIEEMKRRKVEEPGEVLADPSTAIVLARALLRPGVQRGDRFDVEVVVPTRGNATSLRNGRLLPTRLTQMAALGQQIHKGHVYALAEGPVLVDPTASDEGEGITTRGRILGGGVATQSRPLGLEIDRKHQSIRRSQQIGHAINRRFYTIYDGKKQGVANPKTDEFIELQVHPRYRENVARYMQVIRSIAIAESASSQQQRIALLAGQLADPLTSQQAALRLEAIGSDGAVDVLKQQIMAPEASVRFHAAESLAYLDQTEAVVPLADLIHTHQQYRVHALVALSAMNDRTAYDALVELLNATSAEARYGAFRALWAMDSLDVIVRGKRMNGGFTLHVLDTSGPPLIHVTRSRRPEVVLFGASQKLQLPVTIDAGQHIMVNGSDGEQVTVSRFAPGMPVQKRVVSTDLKDVIGAVVDLGGTYPDVVQMLQEARQHKSLTGWFRVDAIPNASRRAQEDAIAVRREVAQQSSDSQQSSDDGWPSLF